MTKQIVEGSIEKVFVKDFGEPDQYGNQYAVNINVGGQWYGLGKKKKPSASVKVGQDWHQRSEGDVIEAVSTTRESNGRTYYNMRSSDITVVEKGQGDGRTSVSSVSSGGVSRNNNPGPAVSRNGADDRQDSMMRQRAMGYAAQIVAATLTSKSDLDQAATDVVRVANDYLLPYAKYGLTEDETRKSQENEVKNQQAQQAEEDSFNDDIPF